jgi:chemotaxis response regulator CheB
MQSKPVIGIICDHNTSVLAGRIRAAGYDISRVPPDELAPETIPSVDAWVIDCPDDSDVADAMAWLEGRVLALSNRPELSQLEEYRDWCLKIIKTLDKWNASYWQGNDEPSSSSADRFQEVEAVWLIAASTGGVSAVSDFFQAFTHIPAVAFVYAQHIQAEQQNLLKAIGHANPDLTCSLAVGRHWLNPGQLLIVPASCQLRFTDHGEVFSLRDGWESEETPNINELMMSMSGMRPSPTGAIVFSGAGKDGSVGIQNLAAMGTRVWAQQPSTCAAPSMPLSVIEPGLTSQVGSPEELAAAFMQLYPVDSSMTARF